MLHHFPILLELQPGGLPTNRVIHLKIQIPHAQDVFHLLQSLILVLHLDGSQGCLIAGLICFSGLNYISDEDELLSRLWMSPRIGNASWTTGFGAIGGTSTD